MPKPVIPRSQVSQDIEYAIAHYLELGTEDAALALIDALEQVLHDIRATPRRGIAALRE